MRESTPTLIGGSSFDYATGIAVDFRGNAYVTGYTASGDFLTSALTGQCRPIRRLRREDQSHRHGFGLRDFSRRLRE